MTEKEIVVMAAEVAAKAAVAAVRAILGKEIQESVEAAVTDAARLGAEASIKAVEQERKKFRDSRSDRRFRNTKLLLRNYTTLNANCANAVYDAASAATGEESVEEIVEALDELLEDDLKVESIMKSAARTQIIMRHVNRMLDIYKAVCGNSLDEAEQRHYRVIEALYLRDRPLSPAAVAEMESIDKRTVYKDVDAACATLSALIFGIDGIKKAYESARTSIEGQIGLFDTMKTSSELSISDMEKAMQSQTDYLNLYSENLKKAAEYGLDDGLIKSLSDGSEESAGYINAIIQNIEKLGGSTEGMPAAASKFVDEFNSKFEETEKAKDAFADNIAKMETDFDKTMSDIEQTMTGTVEKMEMADEAKEAAQATIKAYCDAIRSMTGEAGSAAEAVANAAASHLKTAPTTTPTATTVTGHANGTLSAQEDVYIAGEKGPELIIGARGSEVFPTQETERILAAVNSAENATNAPEPTASPLPENDLPEGMEAVKEYSYLTADGQGSDAQPTGIEYVEPEVQAQTTEEAAPAEEAPVNTTAPAASDAQQEAPASSSDAPSIGETVKRIIIEINGSGSIDVGGMNEESVLDILTRHAKPVLMSIIKGEIFEEGDLAYDF